MIRVLILYCVFVSIACGPSLAQEHSRTAVYEQCYAADYDPLLSPSSRRECWQDWLENHSKDQPVERITYARERLLLADEGITRPLPDAPAEPIPELEHRYPPAPPGQYHTSGCNPICNGRWRNCTNYCEARNIPCKTACETEFRVCLEGCP